MKNENAEQKTDKNASRREAALAAPAVPAKPRNIGRPFQPGDDPRRHMSGRKCADAIAFSQAFARALAEGGDPKALAENIWKSAMKGNPFSIDVILDRLIGPVNKAAVLEELPRVFVITHMDGPPLNQDHMELLEKAAEILDQETARD